MIKLNENLLIGNTNKSLSNLLPYVLYENASGSNGTITLSDNVNNYDYIEIFYKTSNNFYKSVKVPSTAATVCLDYSYFGNDNTMYIQSVLRTISGTQITIDGTRYGNYYYTGSNHGKSRDNTIYITKVIGYK